MTSIVENNILDIICTFGTLSHKAKLQNGAENSVTRMKFGLLLHSTKLNDEIVNQSVMLQECVCDISSLVKIVQKRM